MKTKEVSFTNSRHDGYSDLLPVYTYIQSRFYRAPEIILGIRYNMAIDMWSLGCILAEMHTGYPIAPGSDETEQLHCIMELLGVPDRQLVERGERKRVFFGKCYSREPIRHPLTHLFQILKVNLDHTPIPRESVAARAAKTCLRSSSATTILFSSTSSPSVLYGIPSGE